MPRTDPAAVQRLGAWLRGEGGRRLCLAVILLALAGALAIEAWQTGVTADEPSHLLSAYFYWHGADRLQPRDMPPLIKIAGGWVPALLGLPIPYDHPMWKSRHEWLISLAMIERMREDQIRRVFFLSRLPFLVFPLLTAWLIWRWGAELFGGWVGILLALAYALEPTALAHGALFKNDLAATFGYLLFWYTAWRFWRSPLPRSAAWLGVGLMLAILAKLSMLVLIAVAPAIVALRCFVFRKGTMRSGLLCLVLTLAIPYLGTLAAYQFETRRLPSAELKAYTKDPSLPRPFVLAGQVFRVLPVPAPMWQGAVSLAHNDAGGNPVYLLGRRYPRGHRLYFLTALGVKTPVALQVLGLCALILLALRFGRGHVQAADWFWLLPPALYIGLASLSTLQLGVRLVLPALPFALLVCGIALARMAHWPKIVLPACLFAWLAYDSIKIFPHGIAYFNTWTGGPQHGLKYLADSNIDWGQNLRRLKEFTAQQKIEKLRLFYFGTDNPWAYFNHDQLTLLAPPWSDEFTHGQPRFRPEPGYYAISATLLPGHFFRDKYRDFYKTFRDREPLARVGYSIYVYKIE